MKSLIKLKLLYKIPNAKIIVKNNFPYIKNGCFMLCKRNK